MLFAYCLMYFSSNAYKMGQESQWSAQEMVTNIKDYLVIVCQKLSHCYHHQVYSINMENLKPFTLHIKMTTEIIGIRMVHTRKSTSNTKRATDAVPVSAFGKIMIPPLVFKGKPGGRIEDYKFHPFTSTCLDDCQENA